MGVAKKLTASQARGNRKFLYSWGTATTGQLGDGILSSRSFPQLVNQQQWIAVAANRNIPSTLSNSAAMAIDSDGLLYTWGPFNNGQLARRTFVESPVQIGNSSWTSVAGGFQHSLAIRSDGLLFACI